MLNIKHILFPVDFSQRCCEAVPFVESMARQYKAKVTLLSVAEAVYFVPSMEAGGPVGGPVVVNADLVLNDLSAKLEAALDDKFCGLEAQRTAEFVTRPG